MNSSDNFQSYVPYPDGIDSMGFWPQFPISNDQNDVNSQFDHDPPLKRAKNSNDNQPINHHNNRRSPPVNHHGNSNSNGNVNYNQPTGRMFFKTRHCVKFRMGQCRNGENCNFAHGDEDLRKPPPNWQELLSSRSDDRGNSNGNVSGNGNGNGGGNGNGNGNGNDNWEDDDRIIHKMKLCKKYYNGEECPYGERCNFLHKDPPKSRDVAPPPRFRDSSPRESSAISIGTTGPPVVQPRMPDQFEVNTNRNVVNHNTNGDPLRGASKTVFWKTRRCTRFETTGFCSFGDNCHYAHGQAELLLAGGRPADSEPQPALGSPAPFKAVPPPASDPTPVKAETDFSTNEGGQSKKSLLKWNPSKKINRIYGDWLDDLPLILPDGQ